jgi:succinyl-CoA synthetase beta subunit
MRCPVFAVDAKLNFDDNAAFRQRGVFDMRDRSMEDPRDVAAEEIGLNYIGLDGNIGCLGTCSVSQCVGLL